jgi:hypothetical protein
MALTVRSIRIEFFKISVRLKTNLVQETNAPLGESRAYQKRRASWKRRAVTTR